MTPRRIVLVASGPAALALMFGAAACSSSSSSDNGNGGLPAGCPSDPFSVDAGTFDPTKSSRDDACARYVKILLDRAEQMKCALDPTPTCPDVLLQFEQLRFPGQCVSGYTAGSLSNCECRAASYSVCKDFENKPCQLQVVLDPTGAACGGDGGTDTSGDSLPDTSAVDDSGDAGGGG